MRENDLAEHHLKNQLLGHLAKNLAALRGASAWSTRELAVHTNLSRRTIQRLERGHMKSISLETLEALAKGLGVRACSLVSEKPTNRGEDEPFIHDILASNLVRTRKAIGLTQDALSQLSGVSRPVIAHLERRARNPDLSTIISLSCALDLSVERLLTPTT